MAKISVKKSATKKHVVKKKATGKSAPKKKAVNKSRKSKVRKSVGAGNKIVLKTVLTIGDAKTLHAELGKKLGTKKDLSIDASAVDMVDTAILQLLLACVQNYKSHNLAVKWAKPSQEFLSRSEALNLTNLLGLSETRV